MARRTQALTTLRRRGWVIVASVIAVGALSFGVAKLLAKDHTANAVLTVPPGSTQGGAVSADQAGSLAKTYRSLIPDDQGVIQSVASRAGVSTAVARRNIGVTQEGKTGLMTLDYTADSRTSARRGAEALAAAVTGSNPASLNILPGSLQAVGPARVSTDILGQSVGRASVTVPPIIPQQGP